MKFAENNRISHRQLYRQIVLTFTAPFLLCMFGTKKITGISGIAAVVIVTIFLTFYVMFLIRQESSYIDLKKYMGVWGTRLVGVFFVIYVIFTALYLLGILEEVIPRTLGTDVSSSWISFWILLACSSGTHKGMQRRGRTADVLGGIFLFVIALILLLCIGQGNLSYMTEIPLQSVWSAKEFWRSVYGIICAFGGISFLPFLLEYVEKPGSAWKPVMGGILSVNGIVAGFLLILPAVLGWNRLYEEQFPVLPLLAGADLPGNILARFDVLWMGFLLFSFLFSIGSLLHYGHLVSEKSSLLFEKRGCLFQKLWLPAVIFLLNIGMRESGMREELYGKYLAYVFIPVLVLVQFFVWLLGNEKRKKRAASVSVCLFMVVSCSMILGSCGGVEPEKRRYPLALGVDEVNGMFYFSYGMADLPEATGQEKPEEEGEKTTVLCIEGENFQEIERNYQISQEKYLDMGHLEVLILGNTLLESGNWKMLLEYLKEDSMVGEDIYVFRAEEPETLLAWQNAEGTVLGEYVIGIMENQEIDERKHCVTLRELYYEDAKGISDPFLPEIYRNGEFVGIFYV